MKKYIHASELSGQALQDYINKIQKEVERDLEDIVADLDWSMQDDQVYLSVTFKDDNFTNSVFIFEPWRFTGMTAYIPDDVDMVVRTVENFAKKRKLFNEPYWEMIDRKIILDYDGFNTEYTLYYNEEEGRYVCIFGDSDIYTPETADPDWEGETYEEAREWFDDYKGPGEEDEDDYDYKDWVEDDVESSQSIQSSVQEFFDKGDDVEYWYLTRHGVMPGSVPKGLVIESVIDRPEGTYFSTKRVLTTDALKYYDIKERSPYIKSSQSANKFTGRTYSDLIQDIEENSKYTVDSAYLRRRKGETWIQLYDSEGNSYSAEITEYTDGSFELMEYNITKDVE